MLSRIAVKIARKGFTGPRYVGLGGKLRFLRESTLARRELIFAATPESFAAAPEPQGPPLELHPVRAPAELEPFRAGLEAAWYPGLVESFAPPLGWGEEAVIGTVDGQVACYCWMQSGTPEGFPTYYGRLLAREARILRAGVAPSFRRSGLNKLTMHRLLARAFAAGTERVWAECYLHNLPAARTFLRIGFRAVGVVTVLEAPPLRGFVRWSPLDGAAALYRRHGVDLLAAPASTSPAPNAAALPAGVA
jgi:ribosomal protein S18 acetylase RimI-like enzyme